MTDSNSNALCDPVLIDREIPHGFGHRGSQIPDFTRFPEQVHGIEVCEIESADRGAERPKADIIFTRASGISVGIVTADCVPILLGTTDGSVVGAIHAGWRGLAAGVIEAGLLAIRTRAAQGANFVAAVGPSAGACCYEIDTPVCEGLGLRYGDPLDAFLTASRPGHFRLDLPGLAVQVLTNNGVERHRIGTENCFCTICSSLPSGPRFESYRRDASDAGRLRHFISRPAAEASEG